MRASGPPLAWLAVALLCACLEPSYESLGRNVQRVERADAGSDRCAEAAQPDLLVSGCEPPAAPVGCELGASSWAVESTCAERRVTPCPDVYPSDAERLSGLLSDLLSHCTLLEYGLTVTFAVGCGTAFSLERPDAAGIETVRACVAARLASERYACAETLECAVGWTPALTVL